MTAAFDLTWQPSLLDLTSPALDTSFSTLERVHLDARAWVDYAPAWVSGSDQLFAEILERRRWGQRSRRMYDTKVREPRLTAPWNARSDEPLEPALLQVPAPASASRSATGWTPPPMPTRRP